MGWGPKPVVMTALALALIISACSSSGISDTQTRSTGSAGTSPATVTPATDTPGAVLHVADLNLLHGLPLGNCPPETDDCKAAVRIDLVWQFVEEAGCPEVLTFQEVGPSQQALIPETMPAICGGAYQIANQTGVLPVEQWILTSLPVTKVASTPIAGISRKAQLATIDSPIGPVNIVTTHFVANRVDGGPCTDQLCPSGQCAVGIDARLCDAMEVLDFIDAEADPEAASLLTGDLNDETAAEPMKLILDRGFADTWTVAGNDECDPEAATGCTSGQSGDGPYDGLDIADNVRGERIDYILALSSPSCEIAVVSASGFADRAADPPVDGIYWASDHTGVQAELDCR